MRSLSHLLAAGLVSVCVAGPAAAQQPTAPQRDTIIVSRRDTVVVMRRDTVFIQEPPRSGPGGRDRSQLPPGRGGGVDYGGETPEERRARLLEARLDRTERLRELREQREAYFAALPDVRTSTRAFAVMVYPTRLLELEFPSVNVGVSYVANGKAGVMGSLGVLTGPLSGRTGASQQTAVARGPIRGFDLGLEGRYYVSPLRNDFPMYLGVGATYSLAAVTFVRYEPNAAGTYSQLRESDAEGRRIRGTAVIGWELRAGGLALDLTTGLELNGRGIFTDEPGLVREINEAFWEVNRANRYNPLLLPIIRIGVGIGKW